MENIRNYNNTLVELEVAKKRLKLLNDKNQLIFNKFFPTVRDSFESEGHSNKKIDKNVEYQIELDKINPVTGMSLRKEIIEVEKEIKLLEYYLKQMNQDLQKLTGIENELYRALIMKDEDENITQIIEKFALEKNYDVRTIWRYYENIKEYLEKIKIDIK